MANCRDGKHHWVRDVPSVEWRVDSQTGEIYKVYRYRCGNRGCKAEYTQDSRISDMS